MTVSVWNRKSKLFKVSQVKEAAKAVRWKASGLKEMSSRYNKKAKRPYTSVLI